MRRRRWSPSKRHDNWNLAVMEAYKKTTLKLNAPLKETEKRAVHLFANILREDGNKVEYDEGKINISLNELDYHRIKNDAIPIGKKYDTDILSAILDKIDSIKSYGIKAISVFMWDTTKNGKSKTENKRSKKEDNIITPPTMIFRPLIPSYRKGGLIK